VSIFSVEGVESTLLPDLLDMRVLSMYLSDAIDQFIEFYKIIADKEQELNNFCELVTAVLAAITSISNVPTAHFFLFDKVSYFMITFQS
jgi:hypothetical protein